MDRHWSELGTERSFSRRVGAAVVGVGAVGALAMPVWHAGVGWSLVAAALASVVAVTRVRPAGETEPNGKAESDDEAGARGEPAGTDRWWRIAAGVAAAALVAVAGIRASGGLVALCLLVALALASYTLAGGSTWRDLAYVLTVLPLASLRGIRWAARSATSPPIEPVSTEPAAATPAPAGPTRATREAQQHWRPALGFGIGLVLLVVFGALFRAADPTFDRMVGEWTADLSFTELVRSVLGLAIAAVGALGAAYLVSVPGAAAPTPPLHPRASEQRAPRALRPTEWVAALVMLNALFGLFVWVQLTTLFAGEEYVLSPAGPDYADFARGVFIQLTAVTVLTLGVITVLALHAARATSTERTLLRVLGGGLCALTLVIVASALKRMLLYTHAYGFSGQRLFGFLGELGLGLVFVLILVAGIRLRAAWLPRAMVGTAVALLLGVTAVNPDALMARTHIQRLDHQFPLDLAFLSSLSPDAAGEMARLPEPTRSCALRRIADELDQPDPWYRLNLGRERARELIARHPVSPAGQLPSCPLGTAPMPERDGSSAPSIVHMLPPSTTATSPPRAPGRSR